MFTWRLTRQPGWSPCEITTWRLPRGDPATLRRVTGSDPPGKSMWATGRYQGRSKGNISIEIRGGSEVVTQWPYQTECTQINTAGLDISTMQFLPLRPVACSHDISPGSLDRAHAKSQRGDSLGVTWLPYVGQPDATHPINPCDQHIGTRGADTAKFLWKSEVALTWWLSGHIR